MNFWRAKSSTTPAIFPADKIAALPKGSLFLAKNISSDRNGDLPGYYQTDVRQIKKMLKRFTFPNRGKGMFRCGFDYEMTLFDEGWYPAELKACFDCNRLYVAKVGFEISQEVLLGLFQQYCRPFSQETKTFGSIEEGKAYLNEAIKAKSVIPDQRWLPPWLFFEGQFRFMLSKPLDKSAPLPSQRNMTRQLVERIKKTFPGERFFLQAKHITQWDGQLEYWYYIQCNRSLYDRMDWKEKNPTWMPFASFGVDVYRVD